MLKNPFVKLIMFFVLVLAVSSCDQTRLRNKGNQFFEKQPALATYDYSSKTIPEGYAKVEIDSTLSNGFKVFTKFVTTTDSVYKIENDRVGHYNKTEYREFQSEVRISFQDELILEKRIDKAMFRNNDDDFWNASFMQSFSIDEESSFGNALAFSVTFYNPSAEKFLDYHLIIDAKGNYEIQKA
ncbi:hypothetical protein HX109_05545 [Galbibacter sp. BG1]|uniref:hypothetical protein n=1 Tax=Galbibacter sp. BG1 TaxID=1170699 RepID=UPI0015C19E0B|nr:hypothetical protein [Galbibacter sp. BG1]QLE01053.1 hypothetical protein HX109_05545 [Galbibacter sp. BG1]